MRRIPRSLLAVLAFVAVLGGVSAPAGAEELPPGFTDGRPVGEEPGLPSPVGDAAAPMDVGAEAAAVTERYFGQGAYDAVRTAVAATSRSCPISERRAHRARAGAGVQGVVGRHHARPPRRRP